MLTELFRTALDWYIREQWLSIPLTAVYFVFGYWLGVLNYWVAVKSRDYPYAVRLLLFPLTTVWTEGWMTISANSLELIPIVKADGISLARLAWEEKDEGEAIYAVLFAPVWALKMFVNLFALMLLFALTAIYFLFGAAIALVFEAVLAVKRYYLIVARACFNKARHAEGKRIV